MQNRVIRVCLQKAYCGRQLPAVGSVGGLAGLLRHGWPAVAHGCWRLPAVDKQRASLVCVMGIKLFLAAVCHDNQMY